MWLKVDPKMADTDEVADALERSPHALTVWLQASCRVADEGAGGVVSTVLASRIARLCLLSREDADRAMAALVEVGMWHDAKSLRRCDDCSGSVKLKQGTFFFHAWWSANPTSEAVEVPLEFRMWKLRDELKRNRKLCDEIDGRDLGLCRYCAVRVKWSDKKGPNGGTRDHIDPYGGNAYSNVVIACRRCNGRKGHRTPEQWVGEEGLWDEVTNPEGGRPLLREPVPYQSAPGRDLVHDQTASSQDLASRARRAGGGADQVETGRDLVKDQVEAGREHGGPVAGQVPAHTTNGSTNGAHA